MPIRVLYLCLLFGLTCLPGCGSSTDDADETAEMDTTDATAEVDSSTTENEELANKEELLALISENQTLWQQTGIVDYTYTLTFHYWDCPTADEIGQRTISVVAGEPVSMYYESTGLYEESDLEYAYTVDELFTLMQAYVEGDPVSFSYTDEDLEQEPEFDESFGYPIQFYVDQTATDCDAWYYSISSFF